MLIALDDPIWRRLYGPHQTHDVPGRIARLQAGWDDRAAHDLFWTDLQHQEDLYPVTYAALPWLWALAQGGGAAAGIVGAASNLAYCALLPWGTGCSGDQPRGRYRGLSLRADDHQLSWIAAPDRLTVADMAVLAGLEAWFTAAAPDIVAQAVAGIAGADRREDVARACGSLAWAGGIATAITLWDWLDDDDAPLRAEFITAPGHEAAAARQLRAALGGRAPGLAAMLDRVLSALAGG